MLALLCVAQFVDVLGVTIVVVALPSLQHDLGLSPATAQWVVSIYALCFGGFLIACGRAADVYGSRRLFASGLAVFGVASLVCGLAGAPLVLIAARALQGLGAALAVPAALALLTITYTGAAERGRALAAWTAAGAGGGAAGFVLGGLITSAAGWRWVFLVNVPITAVSLALTFRVLPRAPAADRGGNLGLPGALALTGALLAAIFALTTGELAALAIAVLLGVGAFVAEPLVPPAILRSSPVVAANATAMALTATTSGAAVLATVYVQRTLGLGPVETGLAFLPFSLAVICGSALSPRLGRRVSARGVMAIGLAGVAAALVVLSRMHGIAVLAPAFALAGLSLGVAAVASTGLGTGCVDAQWRGAVSGLLNTSTQLGTAIGVAVLVTLESAMGLHAALLAAAALAAAVAGLVVATPRSPLRARRPRPARRRAPRRAAWRPPWPTARRTPRASGPRRSASAQASRGTSGRCDP
jgi:MFS family permease